MSEGAPCGGKNIAVSQFSNERYCADCFDTRCDAEQCGTVVTEAGVEVHQNAFRADAKRWCKEARVGYSVTVVDDDWEPRMRMSQANARDAGEIAGIRAALEVISAARAEAGMEYADAALASVEARVRDVLNGLLRR